jgi:hypothetical protein
MLTAHQLDKLERIYAARTRMVPLPLQEQGYQDPAEQWQIFSSSGIARITIT